MAGATVRIPRPVAAGVDDRFAVFEVTDESYLPCFLPGAVLVMRYGYHTPDVFHVVETGEGVCVVRLLPNPRGYDVFSCCKDLRSGFFKTDELQPIGTVREFYPHGIHGPRLVFWKAVQNQLSQYELPVLTAVAF